MRNFANLHTYLKSLSLVYKYKAYKNTSDFLDLAIPSEDERERIKTWKVENIFLLLDLMGELFAQTIHLTIVIRVIIGLVFFVLYIYIFIALFGE